MILRLKNTTIFLRKYFCHRSTSLVNICPNILSLKLEENIVILGQHHTSINFTHNHTSSLNIETTMTVAPHTGFVSRFVVFFGMLVSVLLVA